MKKEITLKFSVQIIISLFILSLVIIGNNSIKAQDNSISPSDDIIGNYNFNNGTLTINEGNTFINQTIILGTTQFNNQGIIQNIQVNGTLSFCPFSSKYFQAQEPLNRYGGTSVNDYNGGYFGIIIESSQNTVKGNGTINIASTEGFTSEPNSNPLVGLVAVQGYGSDSTQTVLNGLEIDASGSLVQQSYINNDQTGIVGIALGIAGNASVTVGTTNEEGASIIGAPAVMIGYGFANDDDLSGPENTTESANLVINSGLISTGEINNVNQFSAIKNFGQDTGTVNITLNDGVIDGGDNGAGIYSANSVSNINLNGGRIDGFSGLSIRAGNINIPDESNVNINGLGQSINSPESNIKVDKGNGSAIYLNSNSSNTVAYTGGKVQLNINDGVFISRYSSAIYAQPSTSLNSSPIENIGSVNITGGIFINYNEHVVIDFNSISGGNSSISGGVFLGSLNSTYFKTDNGLIYNFSINNYSGYGLTKELAENALNQLKNWLSSLGNPTEYSPEINQINILSSVEEITLNTNYVHLTTLSGGVNSTNVFAQVVPLDSDNNLVWTVYPEMVATITNNQKNSVTVSAQADGIAILTCQSGSVKAQATISVNSNEVVCDDVQVVGNGSSDYFNVYVSNVQANPALQLSNPVSRVEMFAFSTRDSNGRNIDLNAKRMEKIPGTNDWIFTNIPVNNNEPNEFFFYADSIRVHIYASLNPNTNGNMISNTEYSWINNYPINQNINYITSVNGKFSKPSISSGIAGTTGQNLSLTGLRISSCIPEVKINTMAHLSNHGWISTDNDNNPYWYADGCYIGNWNDFPPIIDKLPIEAFKFELTGEQAQNYELQFRGHVQNLGWLDWQSTSDPDAILGTTGRALHLEAVCFRLVPIGTPLPGPTIFN